MVATLFRAAAVLCTVAWFVVLPGCTQCSEGETREGNQCVRPCNVDGDCAGTMVCSEGRCTTGQRMTTSGSSGMAGLSSSMATATSTQGALSSSNGPSSVPSSTSMRVSSTINSSSAPNNSSSAQNTSAAASTSRPSSSTAALSSSSGSTASSQGAVSASSSSAPSSSLATPLVLTSVTPSSVLQYQPGVELVLAGNGFLAGDGVQLDGADLPTTVQNSTTLTAQLGTLLLEDATTRRLRVVRGTRATQDLTVVVRPSPARREWFVGDALVDQTAGAETYLYIFNPSGRDASVSLHPTGLRPTQQIMVAAGTLGRTTLNTLTPGQHHSYRVDSTQPVVVFSKSWTAGNDASSATTGADPADTLLFATGQADAVAQTDLEIGNFSPVQVSVTVDSFPGGTVTSMVDPWSHLTITQNNGGTFWQRVTASAPVVVEQVVLGPGLRRSARGQGPPQTVGFLPYGVVGGTLNTRIFLVNPSSSTLVTRTIYHLSDGSSLERSNTIPANGLAVRDATLDGVGQDAQFWAQVDAEDATGFVAAATIQDSAVGVDGATYVLPATLAQDLMVPGGNSLAGWVTAVALANPQGVPATVLVEVVFEDGTRQQLNRVIAAGGMALVTQGDLLTAGFFAVRVASDVPVVGAMVSGTGDMLSGVEVVTP